MPNSAQCPIKGSMPLGGGVRGRQKAKHQGRGVCHLQALKSQCWHHSGFTTHAHMAPESSVRICTGCLGCLLPAGPEAHLTPKLGTLCDWKEGGEGAWRGVGLRNQQTLKQISLPIWAVQPSATLYIVIHFEDSPSETLQTETSIACQVLLCFCVGFQPWTTDSGNDSFFLIWKSQLLSKSRKCNWIFSWDLSLVKKNRTGANSPNSS